MSAVILVGSSVAAFITGLYVRQWWDNRAFRRMIDDAIVAAMKKARGEKAGCPRCTGTTEADSWKPCEPEKHLLPNGRGET